MKMVVQIVVVVCGVASCQATKILFLPSKVEVDAEIYENTDAPVVLLSWIGLLKVLPVSLHPISTDIYRNIINCTRSY